MKTTTMIREIAALNSVIAIHTAKINEAWDVRDAAEAAFLAATGLLPWESSYITGTCETGRAWLAASAAVEALKDEDGYFWANSRIADLMRIVADPTYTTNAQLSFVFPGTLMPAHTSVAPWVAATMGWALAA